jgi:hypothetical protein
LGAGGSREFPHRLGGPIAAGDYHIVIDGYDSTNNGILFAEVIHRPGSDAGTGGTVIVSATGHPPTDGTSIFLDATVSGAEVNAACGDTLVVRVTHQGGGNFYEMLVTLDIP